MLFNNVKVHIHSNKLRLMAEQFCINIVASIIAGAFSGLASGFGGAILQKYLEGRCKPVLRIVSVDVHRFEKV